MTLRDTITADATAVFLNEDEFAEPVIYKPHRHYGEALRANRPITALVIRERITTIGDDGEVVSAVWEVHVANDATLGISGSELDTGGDMVAFPPRDGKAAEDRSITQLLTQDHGMLVLECR